MAEDSGSWIEKQNFYNISVVEEEESYKKMYYESDFEVQKQTVLLTRFLIFTLQFWLRKEMLFDVQILGLKR